MATFSERYGYKPNRSQLYQFESMDDRLRNGIWNFLLVHYLARGSNDDRGYLFEALWNEVIGGRSDEFPDTTGYWLLDRIEVLPRFKSWYFGATWNEVYDALEYLLEEDNDKTTAMAVNSALGKQGSAYRFVGHGFVPMTNDVELATVESASDLPAPFYGAEQHLARALGLLGDRDNPDFRNAIKEAISGVESAVKVITGQSNFRKGLEKPGKHSQLTQAWSNMYTWTSNEEGVRHGMTEDPNIGLAEARYMVVACSAFINYLVAKHDEIA